MRRPSARNALLGLKMTAVVLGVCLLAMRAAGVSVSLGQPPKFGWTVYPMLGVAHWAGPGPSGSIRPEKLPPRQSRSTPLGTLVTWADGTRTLYVHR